MFKNIIAYTKELFSSSKTKKEPEHYVKTPRIIGRDEHGIDRRLVSLEAMRTVRNLQRAGYEAYVVGGAVRDLLLGVTPKDFDVVTDATPEQVKRCQKRAIIIGKRFRLVHVMFGREKIECSTFRALEGAGVRKDKFGRVISDNVFGEMWEDAARRDFTINALYYNPTTEELIDYHNGMRDILDGVVRMIGDPEDRYPISRLAPLLANVPEARLFDEAVKLLTCGRAIDCTEKLRQLGLYRNVIPLLEVALKEQKGERFLMLAMKRTDERIAIGKKVSPSFLFATLLWPLTYRHFEERISRGESQIQAMIEAGRYVLDKQCEKLAIQKRFVEDILTIWVLQIKLLRRGTKSAMGLLNIPKFRAGYDFMLLRSQLEYVDPAIVNWWTKFQEVDEATRLEMIREQAAANAQARKPRKGEPKRPSKAQIKKQLLLEADSWQLVRDLSGTAGSDGMIDLIDDEELSQNTKAARPKRRRRPAIRRKKIQIED